MAITLTFHVPPLGTLTATLYRESAQLYTWLDGLGEIDLLKHLDHLGAIRIAWEGAHHPRWEYITVILSLIDRFHQTLPDVHLTNEVPLPQGEKVSSAAELLKCRTLLLNVGHLEWTFFAERNLLFELSENRSKLHKAQLLTTLAKIDPSLKSWAIDIIRNGRLYDFYKVLAFLRLSDLAAEHQPPLSWSAILSAYVLSHSGSQSTSRLRQFYARLRQFAYLTLDPHYTPAAIQLDPNQILTDPATLARWLPVQRPGADDALGALERYMSHEIYIGERTIRELAARERRLRAEIRETLQTGWHQTVRALAVGDVQQKCKTATTPNTIVRLQLTGRDVPPMLLVSKETNIRVEQKKLERLIREPFQDSVTAMIWPTLDGASFVAQFHALPQDVRAASAAYWSAFRYAVSLKRKVQRRLGRPPTRRRSVDSLGEQPGFDLLIEEILHIFWSDVARRLVVSALDILIDRKDNFRWEWSAMTEGPNALLAQADTCVQLLNGYASRLSDAGRRAEIHAMANLLSAHGKAWVATSVGRLQAYHGRNQVCEIDGCFVRICDARKCELPCFVVTLVEAKNKTKRCKSQAKRQLRATLNKLGIGGDEQIEVHSTNEKDVCWAWVDLMVPVAVENIATTKSF